jgi:uncharacterized protein YukE
MSQVGGNLEQLVSLKGKFTTEAGDVQRLVSQISGAIDNTWWIGPAAERFKGSWNSDFRPALGRLQEALLDAAREVGNREQALRNAGN